ncbi:ATP-binding cassette domain-containing protein [Leeia sp. TBRC 13508]|uniref:ATP-binding cassette domain-containing protein n=1 Tax=Leeia speluncae TaxID=2884804 RepID=A0ABS8D9A4_9NEIS|nr:ATP-binding cassette domain-containing protein [Leeia speluncae]MCB6184791.1 ATP-binding cassette domain-containing protein [Leeia speluncae]
MAVLSVKQLCKKYGDQQVVDHLDLSIPKGICFGLLGPNGAGKTTTLKLCLGLIRPDGGEIELLGHAVPQSGPLARVRVGVVPQFDNLDPDFSVGENLVVFGRYFGLSAAEVRPKIPSLLAFAGLEGKEKSQIRELSGGMRRRLTLARALVNDPEVIFLDEPTTGLDPQARHLIWERLRQLVVQGKTLILTTHFMDEAERLCSRLAVMDHGKLVVEDSPRDLIAKHIEPVVVEVFGDDLLAWQQQSQLHTIARVEKAGETLFCYVQEAQHVLDKLAGYPNLRSIVRQANLEDVFIKLTGRELRD